MNYNNTENTAWHTLHNNYRVPINDLNVEGAPFSLFSNSSEWSAGSINKAVYNTFIQENIIENSEDLVQAELGTMNINTIFKYINKDMLYGYNGDSRNKTPGNLLAFRAYPTPVIIDKTLTLITAESNFESDYTGTNGNAVKSIVLNHTVVLKYKVPYDIVMTVKLLEGTNELHNVEVMIPAGSLNIEYYRIPVDLSLYDPNEWILLSSSSITFSIPSGSYSGDKTFIAQTSNVLQAPYYGDLSDVSIIVTEAQYNPPVPVNTEFVDGYAYEGWPLEEFLSRTSICNEFRLEGELTPAVQFPKFYKKITEPLNVGTTLYMDAAATIPVAEGPKMWIGGGYYGGLSYGSIKTITQYLIVNASGVITYFATPGIGYEGVGCRLLKSP